MEAEKSKEQIDSLLFYGELSDFMLKVGDAHNQAIKKHPLTGMNYIGHWLYCDEMLLNKNRKWNDDREREGKFSWHGLLDEEIAEAQKELAQGNWDAARSELVQVAQVAFRAWLWCEQMKAEEFIRQRAHENGETKEKETNEKELK